MSVELLPCPFCGSDELSHGFARDLGNCECHNCNACIWADTEEEAITTWNTRIVHSGTRELRERIEVATGQYHDANEWHFAEAPDGQGSLLDWVCRAALQSPSPMEEEAATVAWLRAEAKKWRLNPSGGAGMPLDMARYLELDRVAYVIERGDHLATIRGESKP